MGIFAIPHHSVGVVEQHSFITPTEELRLSMIEFLSVTLLKAFGCEHTQPGEYAVEWHTQGLNCQKISGGLTPAYSLSLPLHTCDSASLTTAGG
jgi:hypothetical protein